MSEPQTPAPSVPAALQAARDLLTAAEVEAITKAEQIIKTFGTDMTALLNGLPTSGGLTPITSLLKRLVDQTNGIVIHEMPVIKAAYPTLAKQGQ